MATVPPTDVQWEQMDEAWRIFDTDADGLVTPSDLRLLLLTYGFDHSETEIASYLQDLPINLEQDRALDKAQFMLWITKLHERLLVEDREEKIKQEDTLQDLLDSGTLLSERAAGVRAQLAEMRGEREELEAIIEGEMGSLDRKLFEAIDKDGKGFLAFHDVFRLANEIGEKYSREDVDAMFHAVCPPDAERRISLQHFRRIMQAPVTWDEPDMYPCHRRILHEQALAEKALRRKNRRKPPPKSFFWRNVAIGAGLFFLLLLFVAAIVFTSL